MTTIYSITPNRQERYDSVRPERVAEIIKRRRDEGCLNIHVIPNENS